jgi:hypothetical protein
VVGAGGGVLVVSYPRVTWSLVDDVRPPVLVDLLDRSAVASLSVASAATATDPADGYLTIGAGQRASAGSASGDLGIRDAPRGDVEVGALPGVTATAGNDLFGAEPGSLGGALRAGGQHAAVVANADVVLRDGTLSRHREAALATMDPEGRSGGSVADDLARPDASRPGGRTLDESAVLDAFGEVWFPGALVLVEASDLDRADREGTTADLVDALGRSDALLGRLLAQVDLARDLVLVLAPAAPHDRAELTVFAIAGPGVEPGLARSPTTRRAGYVTLPDVAPTVLTALGLDVPDAMAGTAITASAGGATGPGERAALDQRSRFRERTVVPVTVAFLVLQLLVYAAVASRFAAARWRDALAVGVLAVLAFPLLTFLSGIVAYDDLGPAGYVLVLLAAAVVLAGAAWWTTRRSPTLAAWAIVGATWLVLVVDALRGGALQFDTPFGYSPISAARFAGMGNLGLALVMVTALVGATGAWPLFWDRAGAPVVRADGRRAPGALLAAAAAAFTLTVVADGLPGFGADLGGVAAMVPAFAVAWIALSGRRVTWKQVAVAVGAGVVAVVAAAAVDLARPEDDRTHLGRFAERVLDGEGWTIVHRKLVTNLHVLVHPGVVLATVLGVGTAVVAWRRSAPFAEVRRRVPGVGALVSGALVGAVLGFGVNDSGIVVPGMMLAVAVPWLISLAFALEPAAVGSRP